MCRGVAIESLCAKSGIILIGDSYVTRIFRSIDIDTAFDFAWLAFLACLFGGALIQAASM